MEQVSYTPEQHKMDFLYFATGLCNHRLKVLDLFITHNVLYPGMFNSKKMPKPMMPKVLHATVR